jgi:hypothetical protein
VDLDYLPTSVLSFVFWGLRPAKPYESHVCNCFVFSAEIATFDPAWRVALPHCPPPLHQPALIMKHAELEVQSKSSERQIVS